MSNASRPDKLADLTRWNRAGLPRFTYVDGDAASWLEELRLAAMGLVARGAPMDERLPETWRHRFAEDVDQWPDGDKPQEFARALAWSALWRPFPDQPENARRRNMRLLDQYAMHSREYGWEIMRATARATHVLLGHLDAYANEGYLRTATQWDNLAKLAAMVNYHPAPPSSAITSVGLLVDPTDSGDAVEIPRGLAMKHTPPEGGAAVVFETLDRIKVHPDLNECRATGWDRDPTPLHARDAWIENKEAELAPGALAILSSDTSNRLQASALGEVNRDESGKRARIALDTPGSGWTRGEARLHIDAKTVRRGLPRTSDNTVVVKLATASNYPINSAVRVHWGNTGSSKEVAVTGNGGGHLSLSWANASFEAGDVLTIETLVPVSGTGSGAVASPELDGEFFIVEAGTFVVSSYNAALAYAVDAEGESLEVEGSPKAKALAYELNDLQSRSGFHYTATKGAKREDGTVAKADPADGLASRQVTFAGKPPKGLAVGDLFVMRGPGMLKALKVAKVVTRDDGYTLVFDKDLVAAGSEFRPDAHEFHGPMNRQLRPLNHDRNPRPAFTGQFITLITPGEAAREQIRLGRKVLIEDERGIVAPLLATVSDAKFKDEGLELTLEPVEGLAQFPKGWTKLNINTVMAGHGETKSPKVLGSGDAERFRQSFAFGAKRVSFIPSSVAETGTAPDLDVTVNGIGWSYRDLIDPLADGTESWSASLAEDGSLVIHFRQRLPTGTDNVVVTRHRVGVGPDGSVPARAFAKPMKKQRFVRAITQPLPATGGAEREPIDNIRTNAPSRLVANGRAVSLKDFERLCQRRTDIWQASAHAITTPSRSENVGIVVVPANGTGLSPTFREELTKFVEARALPGTRVAIELYQHIGLQVSATVRVDYEKYDRNEVQAAAQAALISAFALEKRKLGQPVYIAEVSAALERVTGVETATIQQFSVTDEAALLRTATTGSRASAYFTHTNQVIAVRKASAVADMAVKLEAL